MWKIARSGLVASRARPIIETFGENVGTLTHEIFGLEVQGTGYHRTLTDLATEHGSYQEALQALNGQLGMEGKAILRALTQQPSPLMD